MALTIFCKHSSLVAHLQNEVEYLRTQVEHERQRAENAIDQLLNVRVSVGPVSGPSPRELTQHEKVIEKLMGDTEFAQSGE